MLPLKSTKTKFIVVASVTLVVVVGYIIFFSRISSINKALATLDHELDAEVENEAQLSDLNNTIQQNEEAIGILNSYFIETDGVVDFINDLEGHSREVGAIPEIVSVDIKNTPVPGAASTFEYLNIQISIDGAWDEVFHFSELLDQMPVHMKVNEMSLENIPGEEGDVSVLWRGIYNIDVLKRK